MKIRFLIISLLLLPFVAQAQYKGAMLEINSKTGVYQVGDSIKVWAVILPECNPVRAYLVYPTDAPAKSLPILIRAHAAGVKGKWCQSSVDQAIKDAKRGGGAIVLDINAHGMLNGQPQSYYDNLDSGQLKGYSSRV